MKATELLDVLRPFPQAYRHGEASVLAYRAFGYVTRSPVEFPTQAMRHGDWVPDTVTLDPHYGGSEGPIRVRLYRPDLGSWTACAVHMDGAWQTWRGGIWDRATDLETSVLDAILREASSAIVAGR